MVFIENKVEITVIINLDFNYQYILGILLMISTCFISDILLNLILNFD